MAETVVVPVVVPAVVLEAGVVVGMEIELGCIDLGMEIVGRVAGCRHLREEVVSHLLEVEVATAM